MTILETSVPAGVPIEQKGPNASHATAAEKVDAAEIVYPEQDPSDKDTVYQIDPLTRETVVYTPELCKAVEREYWRTLLYNAPLYGADMTGSLFENDMNTWNVSKLDNLLDKVGEKVMGVNSPYLYFGMWKATFAWHVEDMDLFSINYIHSARQSNGTLYHHRTMNGLSDLHKAYSRKNTKNVISFFATRWCSSRQST